MVVAIGASLSDLASSDDEEDGEDEDEEETEHGKLSEDDEPSWVMGTISRLVQQWMERFRQKLMKLDELIQPGCGDAANHFQERYELYGTPELKLRAVVKSQTNDNAAISTLTTSGAVI